MTWLARSAVQVLSNFILQLWVRRHLILNFVIRDVKSRYVGSFMGLFWSVVHPLVLLVCYTFVFSIVFRVRPFTEATDNFAVFLFCGILPWLYFQDSVVRCCSSILDNAGLIRKTLFPSEILPVSLVVSNLVSHLIGLAILLVVLGFMGLLSWTLLFLPVFILLLMLMTLGLGWFVAALQVFLRDTIHLVTVFMILWFWFTPIFYSADNDNVPVLLRALIRLNPLSYVVEGYRDALLEHQAPALTPLLILMAFAGAAFLVGGFVFRNTKREFIDVL
jgi:ABC-type polysaccharide/polyol phosphate export permease